MSTTKPHPVQSEFFSTEAESELEHVHKVYDQIALHFSETRYKVNSIFIFIINFVN
jgi:hypothetical protein